MGKFLQCLTELSAQDTIMVWYYSVTFLSDSDEVNDVQTQVQSEIGFMR